MNPLEGALHPARFQQHFQSNQGLTLWDIFRAYVVGRVRGPCWCKVESARAGSLPSTLPTALPVKTGVHIVGHFPGLCRKTGLRPMLWDVFGAHGAARFRGAWCAASSGACRGTCSGLMLWDVVATHIQSQRGAARIHSAIVFRRRGPRTRPTTWGSARLTTSASNTSDNIGPGHSSPHGPRRITAPNMGPDHVLQCRH